MNRKYLALFIVMTLFAGLSSEAQKVRFSKYFNDETLCVYYYRTGNRQHDTIEISYFESYPRDLFSKNVWAGSRTQLLDPFDNGDYRVVVRDAKSGRDLYSRGYNTLFREYRDTEAGRDSVAEFQEVVRLPMPKKDVDILFEERGEDHRYHTQYTYRYKPEVERQAEREKIFLSSYLPRYYEPLKLHYNGDVHKKIDVVIVPEGYGPADSAKMCRDMRTFCDYMLAQEPFRSRAKDFNVWGIPRMGLDSGITDPGKGIAVQSLVGSSYNTFGIDRYLMTMNLFKLHNVIGFTPCDHIIIMANSTTYGGGAIYNFYAMSSLTEYAAYVLPHELGHSIGGLADEYVDEDISYSDLHAPTFEPTEPNITTLFAFDQKWQALLPAGTPIPTPYDPEAPRYENGPLGVYEGAGYKSKGVYRPVMHCMMRDYAPFCPVCTQRLNEVFDLYVR